MTPATFRQIYRALADPDKTPDEVLLYYFGLANNFLNADRFDPTSLDYAVGLFTAHHLTLDLRDEATSKAGGIPGDVRGPSTQKATDKVSQSYDTKAVTYKDAGFWNSTRYGVRLWDMMMSFGAGGIQVDGAGQGPGPSTFLGGFDGS